MPQQYIDIAAIIDEQKFRRFNATLLFWSFLLCFVDGYDFTAPGYVAPSLIKVWHLSPVQLAPIFSAAIIGILCGSPLFGYIGDRYGRRMALIIGAAFFSIITLVSAASTSVWELVLLRFLGGVGLGGVMSLTIVLHNEYAPKRWRATLVCIMFSGLTVGAGIPGLVAAWIVPDYGWQAVFVVGGVIPLLLTIVLVFVLPESIKFLVLHKELRPQLDRMLKILKPGLVISPDAQFNISDEHQLTKISVRSLFVERLAVVTPLLWTAAVAIGLVIYFIQIWTPTLLTQTGVSPQLASLSATMFQLGGMTGAICMGIQFDRWGVKPILAAFVIAIPVVIYAGMPDHSATALVIALFIAGFMVLGAINGLNVLSAAIYPTSIRANGVGWMFGVGRIGFLIGAQIGSLRAFFTVPQLFYLCAIPLVIGAGACYAIGRYRGYGSQPEALGSVASI
jgi:MFS transporter, AAHS family, 4-hydroxybenzoate transporter